MIGLKERSNNCEVKYLSVAKCWFTKTSKYFFKRKGQSIRWLNTCQLLNVGLQRQAICFFKERSNNCEVKEYLSVAKCWVFKDKQFFFVRKIKQL